MNSFVDAITKILDNNSTFALMNLKYEMY